MPPGPLSSRILNSLKRQENTMAAQRYSPPWVKITISLLATLICCILGSSIGSVSIDPYTVFLIAISKVPFLTLTSQWSESSEIILWQIRFPRVILAVLVGSSLAVSGATYQGIFRNVLADPYLIGVASGAGLGATIIFTLGIPITVWGISSVPVAGFIGGICAVAISYFISVKSGSTSISALILAGAAIGAFCTAITAILMLKSEPDLRPVLSWLMGGLIRAQWNHNLLLLLYLTPGLAIIFSYSRILNILQLDESYATNLGVNVDKAKNILILASTLITAAAVSFSGIIGFVGLIAPHTARLLWGGDYRTLIPLSSTLGATFLVVSDLIARTAISPSELPVGIITALFGAPFFLYLLSFRRREII